MSALEQVLADILTEYEARGNDVRNWPVDEAKAYRDAGGFQSGRDAVLEARIAKAATRIKATIGPLLYKAYEDGVDECQYMTGFTDDTKQSVMDQCNYSKPRQYNRADDTSNQENR